MCSRYELSLSARELQIRFDLDEIPAIANRTEVRPTDAAPVIGPGGAELLAWGLATDWLKRPLINARAETLQSKATFRPLLGHRVLVPASAYVEWRNAGDGTKRKNRIQPKSAPGGVFCFAGLIDPAQRRFTIVTCAPAASIAHIHDRMPVILPPELEVAWLDPSREFADVAPLLVPYAGDLGFVEPETPQGDLFA